MLCLITGRCLKHIRWLAENSRKKKKTHTRDKVQEFPFRTVLSFCPTLRTDCFFFLVNPGLNYRSWLFCTLFLLLTLWLAFFTGWQPLQTTANGKCISAWATRGASVNGLSRAKKVVSEQYINTDQLRSHLTHQNYQRVSTKSLDLLRQLLNVRLLSKTSRNWHWK